MLRLEITTQPALLALSIRLPQVEIDYRPESMRIESTPPAVEISIDFPTIEMDASAAWAELGYKPPQQYAADLAAAGRQAVDEAILRWAREGDRLALMQTDVPTLAQERVWHGDGRQINVDIAPKSRVEVSIDGDVAIDAVPGQVQVEVPQESVSISWRRGAVETYLAQKAAIEIRTVGDRLSVLG